MVRILLLIILLLFSSAFSFFGTTATGAGLSRVSLKVVELKGSFPVTYVLYLPPGYSRDLGKKAPLILYLHGAGDKENPERLMQKSLFTYLQTHPELPFMVLAPICPQNEWWVEKIKDLNFFLDLMLKKYRIDPERVYLTGASMGGYGTWHWAVRNPGRFAAIAPICGGGEPEKAKALSKKPIWVFHGDKDDIIPISESKVMVETLEKYKGNVRFTIYPGAGHDVWTPAYQNPELYEWFLKYKR